MKNIVILGGGFAGAYAAKALLSKLPQNCKITLVNKSSRFTFKPLLHEVAAAAFADDVACEPLSSLDGCGLEIVEGSVTAIDLKRRTVAVKGKKLGYDYLIIALGAQTDFFNILGAGRHALKLDSLDDAFRLRESLLKLKRSPSIVVVGAGPTGSELSAEIASFMREIGRGFSITLVDSSPVFLPAVNGRFRGLVLKSFRKFGIKLALGTRVVRVGKGYIVTGVGKRISADLVIWTAGVKPASIAVAPKRRFQGGHFPVNSYLQLIGYSNVFAVGDCALIRNPEGSVVPQLAQSALQEGRHAAANILAAISNKPLQKFTFSNKGFILALGKGYAVASIGGFVFSGFFAWWLNRTVYMMNMLSFKHRLYVAWKWTVGLLLKRRIAGFKHKF